MQKFKLKSVCGAFVAVFCLGFMNDANAEERSVWQRFVNFFTPSGSVQGEGPIFDELRGVESQIDKIEVQYSRERRPGNKTRYRKQLDSLRNVRDSLITVIEKMPKSSAAVATSSSANVVPSKVSSSSVAKSVPNVAQSSAGAVLSSSSALPSAVSSAAQSSSASFACVRDTVFVHDTLVVRDTVVIHDTLYVVLANKPKAAPKEKKKGAEAPVK